MLCSKAKKRIEKSSNFSKFFFQTILKNGVNSTMGLKQTVRKIGEFEKIEVRKIRVGL